MNGPKRSAPGLDVTGAAETSIARSYQYCPHAATFSIALQQRHALALAGIIREIRRLRVMLEPIGRIFWSLEKRIARLTDELERRSS